MTTKNRRNTNSQHRDNKVGAGLTAKQMRRKKPIIKVASIKIYCPEILICIEALIIGPI